MAQLSCWEVGEVGAVGGGGAGRTQTFCRTRQPPLFSLGEDGFVLTPSRSHKNLTVSSRELRGGIIKSEAQAVACPVGCDVTTLF